MSHQNDFEEESMMKKIILISAAVLLTAICSDAQVGRRFYVDAGWQFNGTFSNGFSENASGWGAYLEGGYYFLPRVAAGVFASFNTNNEYFPKQTYDLGDGTAVTTDMYHSLYQVPFGATLRYRFAWKKVQPYVEAKLGANYARQYELYSIFGARDSQWGFYASPEVGVVIHPFDKSNLGFQISAYYSYATNRSRAFGIDGISNAGFKLGLSF